MESVDPARGFRCVDRLIVEVPEAGPVMGGVRLITSAGSDNQLKVARVVVGTDRIPEGAEVLVQSSAIVPGQHRMLGERQVYILLMMQVEAWRRSAIVGDGPPICECGSQPWWDGSRWICSSGLGTKIVQGPPPPKCPASGCASMSPTWDPHTNEWHCVAHGLITLAS